MATESLIAIDPGASTGWAQFLGNVLVDCGRLEASVGFQHLDLTADLVIVEIPVMRSGANAVPAGDLITLAFRAGVVAAGIQGIRTIRGLNPSQWKGQLSKSISQARIGAALREPDEAQIVRAAIKRWGKVDDIWDAIGIGLWAVGRDSQGVHGDPRQISRVLWTQ